MAKRKITKFDDLKFEPFDRYGKTIPGMSWHKISYDDTTSNLVLNPDTFDLNTTNLRISSSNRGVIAMGAPLTTGPTSEGVFINGFGDFKLNSPSFGSNF